MHFLQLKQPTYGYVIHALAACAAVLRMQPVCKHSETKMGLFYIEENACNLNKVNPCMSIITA